jgi:hypothetical protein
MVRQRIRPVLRPNTCDFYPPNWMDRTIWMESNLKRAADKRTRESLSVTLNPNSYSLNNEGRRNCILEKESELVFAYQLCRRTVNTGKDAAVIAWRLDLAKRYKHRHLGWDSLQALNALSLAQLEAALWPFTNQGSTLPDADHLAASAKLAINLIFDKFGYPRADHQLLTAAGWNMGNTPRDEDRVYDDDDYEEDDDR